MNSRLNIGAGWLAAAALAAGVPGHALAQDDSAAPAHAAANAVPPLIPTSAFAARSPFDTYARLSPDGTKIAYSMREDGLGFIEVVDIDSGEIVQRAPLGE